MKNTLLMILSALIFVSCNSNKNETDENAEKSSEESVLKKYQQKTVKYLSGKDSVVSYFTLPQGKGPFPAVIVIHEEWGLNEWMRSNTDALADKGFAALAIDLYRGKTAKNINQANEMVSGLKTDAVIKDIQAAFSFLQDNPKINKDRIGVIGWSSGGGNAIQAAIRLNNLKAAVINYGNLPTDLKLVRKINCPVLGIFGETDRGIPMVDVQNFEQALTDAKKENKIIIYRNVDHGFMNPDNKQKYTADISERAWREIIAFLEKNLMK